MAIERNPNDFDRDAGVTNSTDDLRRRSRLDSELQADPELAEGTAGGGRIGLFAIAVIAILGVVFYGLNNSSVNNTEPTSTASQTAPQSNPNSNLSVPPSGQNPGQNSAQQQPVNPPAGQTTGSATTPSQSPSANAPADPAPPASTPQAAPTGTDAPRANDAAPAREPSN